jgi:hypothetical protein
MKELIVYETLDGSLHRSFQKAKTHAEAKYADALSGIVHALHKAEKFTEKADWLDANTGKLEYLIRLREDTEVLDRLPDDDDDGLDRRAVRATRRL